jgi:small subunit ribosomal protein S21
MLKVEVKGGNIERAIKEMRRKVVRTQLIKQLRDNKQFTKPSIKRREEILKAQYVQKKRKEEEEY